MALGFLLVNTPFIFTYPYFVPNYAMNWQFAIYFHQLIDYQSPLVDEFVLALLPLVVAPVLLPDEVPVSLCVVVEVERPSLDDELPIVVAAFWPSELPARCVVVVPARPVAPPEVELLSELPVVVVLFLPNVVAPALPLAPDVDELFVLTELFTFVLDESLRLVVPALPPVPPWFWLLC